MCMTARDKINKIRVWLGTQGKLAEREVESGPIEEWEQRVIDSTMDEIEEEEINQLGENALLSNDD